MRILRANEHGDRAASAVPYEGGRLVAEMRYKLVNGLDAVGGRIEFYTARAFPRARRVERKRVVSMLAKIIDQTRVVDVVFPLSVRNL